MAVLATEQLHQDAIGLDTLPAIEVAHLLAVAQVAAAQSVNGACGPLQLGAAAMADSIRNDGVLHYIAAGSSGLMAAADAQELGGTYAIPAQQIKIHMAGGLPTGVEMPGATEDDTEILQTVLAGLNGNDTVIAVSASGFTPYTVKAAKIAQAKSATVIAIANNPNCDLLNNADHPILLQTPPELISGSTRMGAATAQKIALNILSTLMAIQLGHVHDGMMVNVQADNIKLRQRAANMVATIAKTDQKTAISALEKAGGQVKAATLVATGKMDAAAAHHLIQSTGGNLRAALKTLD